MELWYGIQIVERNLGILNAKAVRQYPSIPLPPQAHSSPARQFATKAPGFGGSTSTHQTCHIHWSPQPPEAVEAAQLCDWDNVQSSTDEVLSSCCIERNSLKIGTNRITVILPVLSLSKVSS